MTADDRGSRMMHQPPSAADLERSPPSSPECARIRGLLRDYVDGDLGPTLIGQVDEHVHGCRVCSIELSRAEHEVLRLRRAYLPERVVPVAPPAGFASRVLDRLVAAESSEGELERECAPETGGVGQAEGMGAERGAGTARSVALARRSRELDFALGSPAGMLVVGVLLLFVLGIGVRAFATVDAAIDHSASMVVTWANDAFDGNRHPLGIGDSVGDRGKLLVGANGIARVDWRDPSARTQPAASLELKAGEVRLEGGELTLVQGRLEVLAKRDIEIPMTDGTRIGLGAGEYIIAAEVPLDMFDGGPWGLPDDPLGSMPVGMNVSVEVVAGDDARITRPGGAVTLIAKGNIGLYAGGGTVDVTRAGPVATLDRSPQPAPAPPAPSLPQVSGVALEASGMPTVMASVFMRNVVRGAGEVGFAPTGSDGRFTITTAAACERDFAIVLALPSQLRNDLAEIKPPQVVPLLRQGGQAQLERPLRFDFSAPLLSSVADPSGLPVAGVLVEACVVDEVFGALFVLGLRAVTDANGQFQISRLPARLPAHQRLSVLLIHDDYEVACVSVPTRGDVAATAAAGPMQLQPLSEVRFFGLPPNSVHTVLQELGDAPSSVVAVRRTVTADFFGRVSPVRFGAGRMWLVDGPSGDLRALVEDGTLQGVPRFRPDGDAVARDKWFRRLQQLGDTKVVVASSYRHEEVLLDLGADAVSAPVLRVVDVQGHAVSEAQVFAVSGQGPRDSLDVRFVGLSNANGIVSLAGVLPEEGLVVLGANKAVGWLAAPVLAVGGANITLQPPGSVVLGAALRPAPAAVERRVVVRFERYGADLLPGLRPDVVRFACDENQWMVGDVPPGEYRVQVGDHVFEQVVVPPLDWVVIQ